MEPKCIMVCFSSGSLEQKSSHCSKRQSKSLSKPVQVYTSATTGNKTLHMHVSYLKTIICAAGDLFGKQPPKMEI